ncbi:MAG: glutamine--fructose-6-phosphate transaminase (isomerizing), partial [Planctomycetaceae bacterium]
HTRWATHGEANDKNSHPHIGGDGSVCLVHNGVIENYEILRGRLQELGFVFHTATDSEVVAHLIAHHFDEQVKLGGDPAEITTCVRAVEVSLQKLKGTYGLGILFRECPDLLIAVRVGSPLVVGVGKGEYFIASDASPLVGYTDQVVYLSENETAVLTSGGMEINHRDTGRLDPTIRTLDQVSTDVDLGDYPHYMLKEIHEQPQALENALRGRIDEDEATARFGGLNLDPQQLRRVDRIVLTACGTSWHAGLVGEYLLEEFARVPTEVEYASELRYRNPPLSDDTMVFAITQSGETADTLAALRECKRKGHPSLAICNVVGSSIAREADGGIYLRAGAEIGVASTKSFTSQVLVLNLLALYLGRMRHLSYTDGQRMIARLQSIPEVVQKALACASHAEEIARKYYEYDNFLYLGRLYNFPVALEGALKLKEISYVHAEGYPAAEMKHGPIALVDERTPSVFVIPRGGIYPKVVSNLEEVRARKGPVIAIACEGDEKIARLADDVIYVPDVEEHLQPIVTSIPLQFLAYHIALLRGCNVDRPRNLAKSVTVE